MDKGGLKKQKFILKFNFIYKPITVGCLLSIADYKSANNAETLDLTK